MSKFKETLNNASDIQNSASLVGKFRFSAVFPTQSPLSLPRCPIFGALRVEITQ